MNLNNVKTGETVTLKDFSRESSVYFTLSSLGILPGDSIEVIGKAPFKGPISLKHGTDTYFALRYSHAKEITVEK